MKMTDFASDIINTDYSGGHYSQEFLDLPSARAFRTILAALGVQPLTQPE